MMVVVMMVGVIAVVVMMVGVMIVAIVMMIAVISCGWSCVADRDCAENA